MSDHRTAHQCPHCGCKEQITTPFGTCAKCGKPWESLTSNPCCADERAVNVLLRDLLTARDAEIERLRHACRTAIDAVGCSCFEYAGDLKCPICRLQEALT